MGIGWQMRVSIIFLGAVWPVLLNTIDGVRSLDPVVRDMARSYAIGPRDRILRVVLPAASPQIAAGMRASLSIGVVLMVASELLGSSEGIGYFLLQAQRQFRMADMWATMVLLGIVGYALNVAFQYVEHHVLAWHRLSRQRS